MTLEAGTKLGHYEVVSSLGAGGMGEVYRARDTKLGREVAVKLLLEEVSTDPERLARFEREARLLASLNHNNIATLHGFEKDGDTSFLVMELVEGETLADRIKRGAIPVDEALPLFLQIAEGLEAAHEKGVIHRDLKPANIKVTDDGKVKVLDFGLAKAFSGDESDVNLSNSPTLSMQATQKGVILGTAAYMSPEQTRGRDIDKRTDVWAFGCVLYEMLSGRPAFPGSDVTDILAAVIRGEPEWMGLPPQLHERLREVLERCLEKDVRDRYRDIGDVRVDIQKVLADPGGVLAQPAPAIVQTVPQKKLPWVAAIALVAALVGVGAWMFKPGDPRPVRRWVYELPEGTNFVNGLYSTLSIARDGSRFAFATTDGLYVRTMNELDARPLPRTEDSGSPFFSPDSQAVGFWRNAQIETIPITGGSPSRVGQTPRPWGLTWGEDDRILFAAPDGIYSVAASGGSPERIIEPSAGEALDSPQLLPNGRSVLFTVGAPGSWASAQIVVESLDSPGERTVLRGGSDARYIPTGHLVYVVDDALFAVGFDPGTLETTGTAVSLELGLQRAVVSSSANYGISEDGTLIYASAGVTGLRGELVWVDRHGNEDEVGLEPGNYWWTRLSSDGTRLAMSVRDANSGNQDVWTSDLNRNPPTRTNLTNSPDMENVPIYAPGDREIVFASTRVDGQLGFFQIAADGSGQVEHLMQGETVTFLMPYSWADDGATLIFGYTSVDKGANVGTMAMESGEWEPLLETEADELHPAISPDGGWIAYSSDRNGQSEVFVERYPGLGDISQVSTAGGHAPRWSDDGRELFFRRNSDGAVMVALVETGPTFWNEDPEVLIDGGYLDVVNGPGVSWDYDSEKDRFLLLKAAGLGADSTGETGQVRPQITIIENWFEELKRLVPTD